MTQFSIARRLAIGTACAAAATMVLAGCVSEAGGASETPADEALTPITILVPPSSFATPMYAGVSEGIFEEAGFEVELKPGLSMAESTPQLLSGDATFAFADVHNIVLSISEGLPLVIGAPISTSVSAPVEGKGFGNIMVLEESPYESLQDLEGATIGTNSIGGQAMLDFETKLASVGVDTTTIEWVALPAQQAGASLRQGQVDAVTIAEPLGTAALAEGGVRLIGNADDALPGAPMFALATTAEWVEEDPERASAFQDAMIAANELIADDRDLANEVMLTFIEMPEDVLADSVLPTFATEPFTAESAQPLVDRLVEVGAIDADQTPDLDAMLPLS